MCSLEFWFKSGKSAVLLNVVDISNLAFEATGCLKVPVSALRTVRVWY